MKLLKKVTRKEKPVQHKGNLQVLDGISAIHLVEGYTGASLHEASDMMAAVGESVCGKRSAIILTGDSTAKAESLIESLSDKRVPLVIHLIAGIDGLANPTRTGYEIVQLFQKEGYPQFFASTVQEVVDFTCMGHRIAERALTPVVIIQDARLTAHSIQSVRVIAEKIIHKFLDRVDDTIPSPTPSQEMLFGEKRPAIPRWMNPDRPVGLGFRFRDPLHNKAVTTRDFFFQRHLNEIITETRNAFTEISGIHYQDFQANNPEADYLVVTYGILGELFTSAFTQVEKQYQKSVGIIKIFQTNPFPEKELSHLLKNKKAVLVLEPLMSFNGGEVPLAGKLRELIDRAVENGLQRKGEVVHPGYATIHKITERPEIFTAIVPPMAMSLNSREVEALLHNILPDGKRLKKVFTGISFYGEPTRVPTLEIVQQKIKKFYPDLQTLELAVTKSEQKEATPAENQFVLRIKSYTGTDLQNTVDLFSKTLTYAGFRGFYSLPEQPLSEFFQHQHISMSFHRESESQNILPQWRDALIVDSPSLLTNLSDLTTRGILIVNSSLPPEILWQHFPEKVRKIIQSRKIRVYSVNALEIAREIATLPGLLNDLIWQVLLGAYFTVDERISERERRALSNSIKKVLEQHSELNEVLISEFKKAFQEGEKALQSIPYEEFPPFEDIPPERPAPWTVRRLESVDHTVYDLSEYWENCGFFYENDRTSELPAHPIFGSGVVPAGSSAFKDLSQFRWEMPVLRAESCTACGLCWTQCPDAAIQGTIQHLSDLVDYAMQKAREQGEGMIQLQRILKQLIKQAQTIFAKDDLHQYLTAEKLLQEAFERLIEKMQPDESQEKSFRKEFEQLTVHLNGFPIIRSETFFDKAESQEKGSGFIFSLSINPQSCKACHLCVEVCPEDALEMQIQTPLMVQQHQQVWETIQELPDISEEQLETILSPVTEESEVFQLLRKKIFHTIIGGDSALPGSGVKRSLRLLTSAVEVVMQKRYQQLLTRMSELIQSLEDKLQGRLKDTFRVNDFAIFAEQLEQIHGPEVTPSQLAEIIEKEHPTAGLDPKQLRQISKLVTQLKHLKQLYEKGMHGDGRARLAMVVNARGISLWSAVFPYNPLPYPVLHHYDGDVFSLATGLYEGMLQNMVEVFKTLRIAELMLRDEYKPAVHDSFFKHFSSAELTAEELESCPPLIIVLDDVALAQVDIQGLSKILTGDRNIKVAVVNTLQNLTPESRGMVTSYDTNFPGIAELGLWAVMQHHPYVAQISAGYPNHFLRSVINGIRQWRPALFHIYASEPLQQGFLPEKSTRQEIDAVNSRAFPLFTYNPEKDGHFSEKLDVAINPDMDQDWTTQTWRLPDASGIERPHSQIFTVADWALREGRFKQYFQRVRKAQWHERMVPLDEFLRLTPEDRKDKEPYIELPDKQKQINRIRVEAPLVKIVENRLIMWKQLQELANVQFLVEQRNLEDAKAQIREEFEKEKQALEQEYQTKLQQLEDQHLQVYQQRLTEQLLALYKSGKGQEELKKSVKEFLMKTNGSTEN